MWCRSMLASAISDSQFFGSLAVVELKAGSNTAESFRSKRLQKRSKEMPRKRCSMVHGPGRAVRHAHAAALAVTYGSCNMFVRLYKRQCLVAHAIGCNWS